MSEQKINANFEPNELVALSRAIASWFLAHQGKPLDTDEALTLEYLVSAVTEIGRCLGEDWEILGKIVCIVRVMKEENNNGHLN